jgi:hypothetical protein
MPPWKFGQNQKEIVPVAFVKIGISIEDLVRNHEGVLDALLQS